MSLIREIKTIENGLEDDGNSTVALLGISGVFTGVWIDTLNYNTLTVGITADQDSAIDGLEVQWSADGVTVTQDDKYTIYANSGKVYTFSPANRYLRIVFTNGLIAQTDFSIQSILKKGGFKASSHRLGDTLIDEDDAEVVKAVLTGENLLHEYQSIGQFRGALNVHQADVHRFLVNRHLSSPTGIATTISTASVGQDYIIAVADTTGFTIGSTITINDVGEINGAIVTAVGAGAPGTLTLDRRLDNAHPIGTAIDEVDENMVTLGTMASPILYKAAPPADEIWHITRIMISATFASAADDSKFGNLTALTNGMVVRWFSGGVYNTITNWKSNADMKRDMFDVPDTSKSGGGLFGMNGRWTFKKLDFVPELVGADGDFIEVMNQDDLTGLVTFEIHAQGHKVGE